MFIYGLYKEENMYLFLTILSDFREVFSYFLRLKTNKQKKFSSIAVQILLTVMDETINYSEVSLKVNLKARLFICCPKHKRQRLRTPASIQT